ncbi:MAG: lipid-A-disaccharide synthase [Planctomycetes bacterium]|nr:lipid-A-disaccharide synthase [Planctomycetota bacterium]
MQVFFSVGEPSGDLHGANLIEALKRRNPDWEYVGYGGPRMAAAGCQLHADLTQLAVMWVAQVLWNIRKFLKLLADADQFFQQQRPDLVVLIDYPGFNWWIARKAKAQGIPVVYYGTPQLWAWAGWRVSKMRRFVDHVLCKLPFEEAWFRQRGCQATFVGHPYFDELRSRKLDQAFVESQLASEEPLVTILPGSRTQEVKSNLAPFLQTAKRIQRQVPKVRFAIAVYKSAQLELVNELVDQSGLPVEIHVDRTAELIHAARCCLACSGSVSLELLYHTKPSAILYQISKFGYFVQWMLRKIRYITLVNLLTAEDPFADRSAGIYDPDDPRDQHVLMPEYLTYGDRTTELAQHVVGWLTDDTLYANVQGKLSQLKSQVAQGGASERAAEYISTMVISTKVLLHNASHPRSDAA